MSTKGTNKDVLSVALCFVNLFCGILQRVVFLLFVVAVGMLFVYDAWPIRNPPLVPNGDSFAYLPSTAPTATKGRDTTSSNAALQPHKWVFSPDVSPKPSVLVVLPAKSAPATNTIVDCLHDDGSNSAHLLPKGMHVPVGNLHLLAQAAATGRQWLGMGLRFVIAVRPTRDPSDPSPSRIPVNNNLCPGSFLHVRPAHQDLTTRHPVVLPMELRRRLKALLQLTTQTQNFLASKRLGKGSVTVSVAGNASTYPVDVVTYNQIGAGGMTGSILAKLIQVGALSGMLSTLFTSGTGIYDQVEVIEYIVVLDESRALLHLPDWLVPSDSARIGKLHIPFAGDALSRIVGPLMPSGDSSRPTPLAVQLTTVQLGPSDALQVGVRGRGSFALDAFTAVDQGYNVQESHRRDSHYDHTDARTGRGEANGTWNWRQSRTVYTPVPRLVGSPGRNRQVLGEVGTVASVDLFQPYAFAMTMAAFVAVGGVLPEASGFADHDAQMHPPVYGANIKDALDTFSMGSLLRELQAGQQTLVRTLGRIVVAPLVWLASVVSGPEGPALATASRPSPLSELLRHPGLLDRREAEIGFSVSIRLHRLHDQLHKGEDDSQSSSKRNTPISPTGAITLLVRSAVDDATAWALLAEGGITKPTQETDTKPLQAPFSYVRAVGGNIDAHLPLILSTKQKSAPLLMAAKKLMEHPEAEDPSDVLRLWRLVLSPAYDLMVNLRPVGLPSTMPLRNVNGGPVTDEPYWQWHMGVIRTLRSERQVQKEMGEYLTHIDPGVVAAVQGQAQRQALPLSAAAVSCFPNVTSAYPTTFRGSNWVLSSSGASSRSAFDLLAATSVCSQQGAPSPQLTDLAALHSTISVVWSMGLGGCMRCCGFTIEVAQFAIPLADSTHYANHAGGAKCFCGGYDSHVSSLLNRVELQQQGVRLHRALSLLPAVVQLHGVELPPPPTAKISSFTHTPDDVTVLQAVSTSWLLPGVLLALSAGSDGPTHHPYAYSRQREAALSLTTAASMHAPASIVQESWELLHRVALPVLDKTHDSLYAARQPEVHPITFRDWIRRWGFPCYTALRPTDFMLGSSSAVTRSLSRLLTQKISSSQPPSKALVPFTPRYVRRIIIRHTLPDDMVTIRERVFLDRADRREGLTVYDYHVCRSMFEASSIYQSSVWHANRWCDEVWVPGEFLRKVFISSGVEPSRVVVIPEGTDVDLYDPRTQVPYSRATMFRPTDTDETKSWRHWCNRPFHDAAFADEGPRRPFVFLSSFKWEPRKGWKTLVEAYFEAFAADKETAVLLNIQTHLFIPAVWDNRDPKHLVEMMDAWMTERTAMVLAGEDEALKAIYRSFVSVDTSFPPLCLITQNLPERTIPRLYATADAFVLPTRAEGWGLPIILGMAMGLPTVTTNWGGVTEFAIPGTALLIDVLSPEGEDVSQDADFGGMEPGMRVGSPISSHLKTLMRQLYNDPTSSQQLGARARAHVVANFSSSKVAALTRLRLTTIARKLQLGEGWV